jgi:hypothetical protein
MQNKLSRPKPGLFAPSVSAVMFEVAGRVLQENRRLVGRITVSLSCD